MKNTSCLLPPLKRAEGAAVPPAPSVGIPGCSSFSGSQIGSWSLVGDRKWSHGGHERIFYKRMVSEYRF